MKPHLLCKHLIRHDNRFIISVQKIICSCCKVCLSIVHVSTSAIDCLERLVSDMTYYVSSGTLNPTHSLTPTSMPGVRVMLCCVIRPRCVVKWFAHLPLLASLIMHYLALKTCTLSSQFTTSQLANYPLFSVVYFSPETCDTLNM